MRGIAYGNKGGKARGKTKCFAVCAQARNIVFIVLLSMVQKTMN
ncbi:hypothetical protein SpAn4DRAFT_2260 [Sporomusa ovata]|uniref:Uncharacterized protein n=1 Tax=Sporomusa ovata TaxID=2378 RepID=A0A0U1L032_9FIRM|nr:hypothetical protein SpAn4DRAFT_2260 [Sporomusa ovata]